MKMKTVDVTQSAMALEEFLANDVPMPLIITREGKPLAVLLPTPGADVESISLSFDPEFLALIQESRWSGAKEGGIPIDEVEAMFRDESKPRRAKSA
jgi:hypothetical protein